MGKAILNNILLIDNSTGITGAYRSMAAYCRILESQFRYYFAVPAGCWKDAGLVPEQRRYSFNYLELRRSISLFWYLPKLLINTLKARKILKANDIGIVHVNDIYNMLGICLKFLDPQIKLVYHIRLRKSSYARPLYRVWLGLIKKFANHIICVSECVARDVGPSPKVRVIYDALEENWLSATHSKVKGAQIQLLYVGNYIPGKGHNYALEVLHRALKQQNNLRLKFIGGDLNIPANRSFLGSLKKQAFELGIQEYVEFKNASSDIAKEMQASDMVLNFSESESFSMVCLEALACQTPIVATRSGGPEEIIRHRENGILVKNKCITEMVDAVLLLATDETMRLSFSIKAREDFSEKFNIRSGANHLATLYLQ